jgi:hypothetical protein
MDHNFGQCSAPLSQAVDDGNKVLRYSGDGTPLGRFLLENGAYLT